MRQCCHRLIFHQEDVKQESGLNWKDVGRKVIPLPPPPRKKKEPCSMVNEMLVWHAQLHVSPWPPPCWWFKQMEYFCLTLFCLCLSLKAVVLHLKHLWVLFFLLRQLLCVHHSSLLRRLVCVSPNPIPTHKLSNWKHFFSWEVHLSCVILIVGREWKWKCVCLFVWVDMWFVCVCVLERERWHGGGGGGGIRWGLREKMCVPPYVSDRDDCVCVTQMYIVLYVNKNSL